jgi:hypothetical protein
MLLTDEEEKLVKSLRSLPKATADRMMLWTRQLAQFSERGPVEWSANWTEEDLRDVMATSISKFEEQER